MPAKLVAIGDSLTQGFQSGSVHETLWSYPAILAYCLGAGPNAFRFPNFGQPRTYASKVGEMGGGLPVNLEDLFRLLAERHGKTISWYEMPLAYGTLNAFMSQLEDYWERGEGRLPIPNSTYYHNLAVWGFTIADASGLNYDLCTKYIPTPTDNFFPWQEIPEYAMYRTARRVLNPSGNRPYAQMSQIQMASQIKKEEGGIENLIVWLGSNNCLGTVTSLDIRHAVPGTKSHPYTMAHLQNGNLWSAHDFADLVERVFDEIQEIGAERVFVATVPHVTIAPVCRGVSLLPNQVEIDADLKEYDGYYPYYTHFWVWDYDFQRGVERYPYLSREDAIHIDKEINHYNKAIKAKASKLGWHVVDICSMLDKLAYRRHLGGPSYQFPKELARAMKKNPDTSHRVSDGDKVHLDTRYLHTGPDGKLDKGGIFSLDGIHPTTIGYGLIAHEFLKVMKAVGVSPIHPLDWAAIVEADTLVTKPPINLADLQNLLGFVASKQTALKLIRTIAGEIMS